MYWSQIFTIYRRIILRICPWASVLKDWAKYMKPCTRKSVCVLQYLGVKRSLLSWVMTDNSRNSKLLSIIKVYKLIVFKKERINNLCIKKLKSTNLTEWSKTCNRKKWKRVMAKDYGRTFRGFLNILIWKTYIIE